MSDLELVVGWCPACAREVLTHISYDEHDREHRACVDCDAEVEAELRLASAGELAEDGYVLYEDSGCGSSGSGCGSGGCGRG